VDKVVDHVIHTLSPMAKRGVVLEKALAMASLPPIVADERRIMQLLSNLIGNALKFTDKVQDSSTDLILFSTSLQLSSDWR
jgi:signal transduction histidine kinase